MAPKPTSLDSSEPPSSSMSSEGSRNPWVEKWQAGIDPEGSFRQIFNQYYRWVYSYFVRKGFPADESHDLAQETFLRVHKSLATFRRESRFETWLFQITANVYRNTLRSQSTRKRDAPEVSLDEVTEQHNGSENGIEEPGEGPLAELLSGEAAEVLHRALQELPSQMRRCVQLRVAQDLKYREIADIMRVSIDTVKAHLFQARQLLKVKLADYYADPNF